MTRYFFDIFNRRELICDKEGELLSGFKEAYRLSMEDARELAAITIGRLERLDGRGLRVRDEAGCDTLAVPFVEVTGAI